MRMSCNKKHDCGHKCKGYANEQRCLPCLEPDCLENYNLTVSKNMQVYDGYTADDLCGLCYISGLGDQPSIMLGCRHIFHVGCILKRIKIRWTTPWIQFDFMNCPTCKQTITVAPDHVVLNQEISYLSQQKRKLEEMALQRLKHEGMEKKDEIVRPGGKFYNNPLGYAMDMLRYFQCFKCKNPYFGGLKSCAGMENFKAEELICGKCACESLEIGNSKCAKHGTDFIEFKCRFCCSMAAWFCWGTTHFCEACHKRQCSGDYVSRKKKSELPKCGGKATCPLKVDHPPNGDEFSLGCSVCRS